MRMSGPGPRSSYDGAVRPGRASRDASHRNHTALPSAFLANKQPSHGSQDLELQMYLAPLGPCDNLDIPGSQDYSTDSEFTCVPSREDEPDPLAHLHQQSLYQDHDQANQDITGNDDARYLQVPSAQPPWNADLAANASRQTQTGVSYRTPAKQQTLTDEGYFTNLTVEKSQQDTRSWRSGASGSLGQAQNMLHDIPRSVPNTQRRRAHSYGHIGTGPVVSQTQSSQQAPRSDAGSNVGTISCESCEWVGKTLSDFKKHCARHQLHHVCDHAGCSRDGKGFATVNDLNRHQKSVHKISVEGDRWYRCFARGCGSAEKEWPRKDNFRSHLTKQHPHEAHDKESIDKLVKMSEDWWDDKRNALEQEETFGDPLVQQSHYYQPPPCPTTPCPPSSGSDAGLPQSSPASRSQFSTSPWQPHDTRFAASPIPNTPQYTQRQNAFRQAQQIASLGYHVPGNTYSNFLTPNPSTGSVIQSSAELRGSQQRIGTQNTSVPGTRLHSDRAQHFGQATNQSYLQNWQTQPAMSQTRPISRTNSVNPGRVQPLTIGYDIGHFSRTVADPFLLEERRHEEAAMPVTPTIDVSTLQPYPSQTDVLAQVGVSWDFDFPSHAAFTNSQLAVPSSDATTQTKGVVNNEFSVDQIREFLRTHASNQVKDVLESALNTFDGSNTDQASTDSQRIELSAEALIEETLGNAGKIVYRCRYEKCTSSRKSWNLLSQLRKHINRHTKPYGCTFELCYDRFGSKSDWVRHEVKRHSQQESWRCDLRKLSASQTQYCCKTFGRKEMFIDHLKTVHGMTDAHNVNSHLKTRHISAGFQPQYWCGFCESIQQLKKKGKDGYHERYDHIANHITKEDRCIVDWIPPDDTLPKAKRRSQRLLAKQRRQDAKDQRQDMEDVGSVGQQEGEDEFIPYVSTTEETMSSTSPPVRTQLRARQATVRRAVTRQRRQQTTQLGHGSAESSTARKKRTASAAALEHDPQPARRRATQWACHMCRSPNSWATSPACYQCDHHRCNGCQFQRPGQEDNPAL